MSQTPTPSDLIEIRRVKAMVAGAGTTINPQCFLGPQGPAGPQGAQGPAGESITVSTITTNNAILYYTTSDGILGSPLFTFTSTVTGAVTINLQGNLQTSGVDADYIQINQQTSIPLVSTGVLWYNSNTGSLFIDSQNYSPTNILASNVSYLVSSIVGLGSINYLSSIVFYTQSTSIALGSNAGFSNQSNNSIAIGVQAGYSTQQSYTVAVGYQAGYAYQGEASVAIGCNAAYFSQQRNAIAIGYGASFCNQGLASVSVGGAAGYYNQGTQGIAIGGYAGYSNQGINSIAIGAFSGSNNQPANTIILNASGTPLNGVASQISAFYVNPVRNDTITPTLCNLLYDITTSEITYGGTTTNVSSMQGIFSSIGVNCNLPSYTIDVDGTIHASGAITQNSDRRIKENITPITQALEKIQKLQGVYYSRKDLEDKSRSIGFIAQEVEEVVPEVVLTDTTEDKKKSIAYQNLTALLTEGIKEQQAEFSTFRTHFYTLSCEHSTIKSQFISLATEHSTLQGNFTSNFIIHP